jgi:hypothetical protein
MHGCSSSLSLAHAARNSSGKISQLLSHGKPDMDVLNALGTQYDTLFVGPPLGAAEHGAV